MRDRFVRCAVVVVLGLAGFSWLLGACRGPSTPPGAAPGGATTRPPAFEIELVSSDTGAPIARAELEISSAGTQEEMLDREYASERARTAASRITDERGLARFEAIPRGFSCASYRLTSEPFGWSWHAFDLSGAETEVTANLHGIRRLRIELPTEPDLALRGRVVERLGGAPIAGARVRLFDDRTRFETPGGPAERFFGRGTTTDEQGRFELSVCSRAGARLVIEAQGFAPAVATIRSPWPPAPGAVAASGEVLELDAALDRAPVERLQVVDAQGRPAAGVAVRARALISRAATWLDSEQRVHVEPDYDCVVTTDERGECELPLSQAWHELVLSRDGRLLARIPAMPAGQEEPRRIVLADLPPIRGVARSPDGRPEAGVELWLVDGRGAHQGFIDNPHRPLERTTADEEGRFEFPSPCPGDWLVAPAYSRVASLEPDARAPAPWGKLVHVEAGRPGAPLELTVWRGHYLRGCVSDPTGAPTSGVQVMAVVEGDRVTATVSYQDGSFVLGPLPGEDWRLSAGGTADWVASPEMLVRAAAIGAAGDGISIRLEPAARLDARIRDARGEVARDLQVMLWPRGDSSDDRSVLWPSRWAPETSGPVFEALRAGPYDLLVRRPADKTIALAHAVLEVGERRTLDMVLGPAASLRIRNDRADAVSVEYRIDGRMVDSVDLPPGAWVEPELPECTCEMRVLDARGKELARESIELAAGTVTDYRVR